MTALCWKLGGSWTSSAPSSMPMMQNLFSPTPYSCTQWASLSLIKWPSMQPSPQVSPCGPYALPSFSVTSYHLTIYTVWDFYFQWVCCFYRHPSHYRHALAWLRGIWRNSGKIRLVEKSKGRERNNNRWGLPRKIRRNPQFRRSVKIGVKILTSQLI